MTDTIHSANEIVALCVAGWQSAGGEARRLFHGRGRRWPGFEQVCVDGFPPLAVATFFRAPEAGMERELLAGLRAGLVPLGMTCLVVQRRYGSESRADGDAQTEILFGNVPAAPEALEAGLRYRIDPQRGQNLGFFPDMRLARGWVRARSAGKSVLNLFAFTCAFSVAARAGGAQRIVNIDLSRPSLALGRENHRLNNQETRDIHFLDHDVFRSWNKLHRLGRYDLVIMDPPTAQKGSFMAEKDYGKVVRRFSKLLKLQGDVLACLNAPHLGEDFLDEIFARELPGAVRIERLKNPSEYADIDPQAALKVVHYRYSRPPELPPLGVGEADAVDDASDMK